MSGTVKKNKFVIRDVCEVLFSTAAEGLIVIDEEGTIQLVNPSLEEMFGYSENELRGKKIEALIPHALHEKHISHRESFAKNPRKRTMGGDIDLYGKTKDDRLLPLEISINHFMIKDQMMIMALVTEISTRKRIIRQSREEKRTAQMYLDAASTMFVLIDSAHNVKLVNKMACEVLGYEENEIVGKNWFHHFIPKHHRKKIEAVFEQLMKEEREEYKHYENLILTKEGLERLISWNNIVIKNDNGEVTGTLSSGIDITEQAKTKAELLRLNAELEQRVMQRTKALEESQQLYKMIARHFPNGDINVLDENLNYVFVDGTDFYSGITGELLIGTSFLIQVKEDIREEVENKLKEVLDGANVSFELKIRNKTYMINAGGLSYTGNKVSQVLMVSQNITSLKEAEEQSRLSLEKERHLNELKSRFVSMASHEFRTPLTSILNSTTLISKYVGNSTTDIKQLKHINRIKASVADMINILNDFLSLDKLEEGKIEVNRCAFNLPEFMKLSVEQLESMAKKGQRISYHHKGRTEVNLDKQIIRNIINNLLSNAIKYSNEDSIVEFDTVIENGSLMASVTDNGIGIPKDEQDQLFQRFFRAKNALNIQGTGLGLNIAKKYVDIVGGRIDFESHPGKGTTFSVEIPLI